ncbi:MAG: ATP-binding protein [Clostridia bacterium]|nr:ATP-binding protein [Clostridia bacterium]
MSYNPAVFEKVKDRFYNKHLAAEAEADARRRAADASIPGLAETDRDLALTGSRLMAIALKQSSETVEEVRADVTRLRALHERLLTENGFPADYTDPKYECQICSDTGYDGSRICSCMRRALVLEGYEAAGISELIKSCSFESFNLDYFRGDPSVYDNMKRVFGFVRDYAERFTTSSESLIFFGNTGLGKTHLSVALSKRVTDRGFYVLYTGAVGLFGDFEAERFGTSPGTGTGNPTDAYYSCDLLVIDDLGSEVTNQFTTSVLYDLLNRRINQNRPTVISTNVSYMDLGTRYTDRIASRLFGNFSSLLFTGRDIRMLKLENTNRKLQS